jgi:hypothetical protein
VAWLLLVASVAGFASVGANSAARPYIASTSSGSAPAGFARQLLEVVGGRASVGSQHVACALVAHRDPHSPGAVDLSVVGGADGDGPLMVVFSPQATAPMHPPVRGAVESVAWFSQTGFFLALAVVPPCLRACPAFGPGQPYAYALEATSAGLSLLGVGPGARIGLGGSC